MLITLSLCLHIHPFCSGHLKTLVLTVLLLGLGYATDALTSATNIAIPIVIKNVLLALALLIAFRWQISPELNKTLHEKL